MTHDNATKLLLSQLFMIAGLVAAGVGLVGALATDVAWLYFCLAGIASIAVGSLMLRSLTGSARRKGSSHKSLSKNRVAKLVLQNNVTELVSGLALAISGMLMNGIGLIAGFASDSTWFYLCVIGLLSLVAGIWLMQGEIRRIIRALQGTTKS